MSEATPKPEAEPETKPERDRLREVVVDLRVVIGLVCAVLVALFGGGWKALAQVRDEAKAAAKEEVAGISTEQESLKASVAAARADVRELREEQADTRDEVRGLRKDLRRLFPSLPAAKDGGQ